MHDHEKRSIRPPSRVEDFEADPRDPDNLILTERARRLEPVENQARRVLHSGKRLPVNIAGPSRIDCLGKDDVLPWLKDLRPACRPSIGIEQAQWNHGVLKLSALSSQLGAGSWEMEANHGTSIESGTTTVPQ